MTKQYRYSNNIDYIGDFPGARREVDRIAVDIEESVALQVADDIDRLLGAVTPASGSVWAVQEDTPLDVSGATVAVQQDNALDVSASTVPVSSPAALDASAATVPVKTPSPVDASVTSLPDNALAELDAVTLSASGTETLSVSAVGVDRLHGTVVSTGSYDVDVSWQTSTGTEVESVSIVSGEVGGTPTHIDVPARTPYAVVTVTDTSAADQTVTGVVHTE